MNTAIPPLYNHPYAEYRFENSSRYYSQPATLPEPVYDDEDQIPTMDDFKRIIDDYLNNLSPKKRDKALVDQHRYHLIQMVLRDPRNTGVSTAQFRFWVKKMFNLQKGSSDVVCHDGKPVAMKEQIYEILVKAHRDAHHGGRDKTSALVRKRFSWIPKELVARFVRHCPYCITRRNTGHSPSLMTRSPRSINTRFSCSFDSTQPIRTPSSIKEESDISESGYEHTLTYSALSSPQKSYITESKDEPEFLAYELLNRSSPNNLTLSHPQPPSPLFYNTGYSFYNYNTNYYPNALEITPSTSPGAAVAVAAASSTAASAAAAAAITSSLLSHNDHYNTEESNTRNNHFSSYNMPENTFI